ncbi:MAG TPA: glycosyltransferase family 4 protein, partial [Gemmatimonadaceae bacterium]|nr:glycosyltransferase family 4 protein [Gemmatimonadaceae bacterium]
MAKAKLLFLSQTLPYPPDSGTAIRSYNVLRLLARDYDVTALCFYRRATTYDLAGSLAALRAMVPVVEAFPIEQEHSTSRLLWDHARSVLTGRAYTAFAYESAAFTHALLSHLEKETFDLAHLDSLDLGAYVPALAGIPVVAVHQNVESALLRRRAANESRPMRRAYLRMQARLMEKEERRWSPRVALNLAVSDADAAELSALVPNARFAMIPNGVDVDTFVPSNVVAEDGIVFVGGMSWFPNADALRYFDEEILPLVRSRDESVKVTWVGRAKPEVIERYAKRRIQLTGHVDDIRPYVANAACYVVPLRIGGGTRLKILDAWAMGKAVVATSVGCEGLEAVDGQNILIRDDPASFAAAVATVLHDTGLRTALERNARITAERLYSWDV